MRIRILSVVLLLEIALAAPVQAHFGQPICVPADRLIPNTEALIREQPDNAEAHYTLGRIHYLVFVNQALIVEVFDPDATPPEVAQDWQTGIYLRKARCEKVAELTEATRKQMNEVRQYLDRLRNLPPEGITPIIFSLDRGATLEALLANGGTAVFDLDGDGVAERWPWVKETTGILVWDPTRGGCIVSGRQLFGTATWWLLFTDGYAALDGLDDSRDGWLSGSELSGIAVWFDLNGNGRSEAGEVIQAIEFGVESIATRPASRDDVATLLNPQGILMRDGRILPTFDWIAVPISSSERFQRGSGHTQPISE